MRCRINGTGGLWGGAEGYGDFTNLPVLKAPTKVVEGSCALDEGKVTCWGSVSVSGYDDYSIVDFDRRNGYSCMTGFPKKGDTTKLKVYCGDPASKPLFNIPESLVNPVQVATGGDWICALEEYARIRCWGPNVGNGLNTIPELFDPSL